MKKIPKIWLLASIGLFATAASCEKTVTPTVEQINSCTECGGTFAFDLKTEKVKVTYDSTGKFWGLESSKFLAPIPCKFPKELLIAGKEFTFDGKGTQSQVRNSLPKTVLSSICIEKIY
jgi:hypothetical protein